MASRAQLLTGIGVGFGLMYLLDPGRGARRRARVRDAAVNAMQQPPTQLIQRDVTSRIALSEQPPSFADALRARMMSAIGRSSSASDRSSAGSSRILTPSLSHRITASSR